MDELQKQLKDWSLIVKNTSLTKWDGLPDIELYMDQVITYIEKQLQIFQEEEESKLITPSMINNYVKDGVIKHAVKKRYCKEHLATLTMVGILKQILPLSQISKLTGIFNTAADKKNIYDLFINTQKKSLGLILDKIDAEADGEDIGRDELFVMALNLSCEAFANRIAAERIFKMIQVNNIKQNSEENKKENLDKNKKKETKKVLKKVK